jgi:hypothetical protein
MGLEELIAGSEDRLTGGTPNRVDVELARMDDATRAKALTALRGAWSYERVADAITAAGHPVKWGSVRNWRKANGVPLGSERR